MSFIKNYYQKLVAILLSTIATMLALFGSASLSAVPVFIQIATSVIVGILSYLLLTRALQYDFENHKIGKYLMRWLSRLVVILILVTLYTSITSLWFSPLADNYGNRFTYENIATGAGFTAILLITLLSTIQKDTYWITRRKSTLLDERQIKERQEVFEKSYKYAIYIMLGSVWYFAATAHNIPAIISNHNGTVPGHLIWLPGSVLIFMFALPLLIAVRRNK